MNFEVWDIWILAAVVGITIVGYTIFRLRNRREAGSSGKQFLRMGIIWLLLGLGYGIWRDENLFDIGFFNLGLIFTVAGAVQIIIERYKRESA